MDRRTRILAAVFGAAIGYAAVSAVVYPRWIVPILTLDDQIAERQGELDELEEGEAILDRARETYVSYLNRVGSFDPIDVENDLRERLNDLITKHGLEDQNVTRRGPSTDRKTDISKITISVTASGTLDGAVGLLRDVAELPYLLRIGNVTIYPAGSSRRDQTHDKVNLRVPIDAYILPQHILLGRQLEEEELTRPESLARYEGGDYGVIAERKPFTEYIPPKPLVALAGGNMSIDAGAAVILKGTVTGGVGEHTIIWTPVEEFVDSSSLTPRVQDTSVVGEHMFMLSVTDEAGNSSVATVTLTIREPPQVVESDTEPEVEQVAKTVGPKRWPNRGKKRLKMALIRMEGDARLGEFMVYDVKSKESSYYATGDEFDGGQLMYVHPRGALVRRQDEYFVYPIGANLDEDLPVADAVEYPRLRAVAEWFVSAQATAELEAEAEGGGGLGADEEAPIPEEDAGAEELGSEERLGAGAEHDAGEGKTLESSEAVQKSEAEESVKPAKPTSRKPEARKDRKRSKKPVRAVRKTRPVKSKKRAKVIPGKK